jgi:trk system potassium uptake protein TrkA
MYVVVAGGGKVGFYLAKSLLNEGHEVLIIERDRRHAEEIGEELGSVVLHGDAAEASVLAEAGVNRADVVVAVTGEDEDNLVICQVAKRKFNVPRTIARANNPKNQPIFQQLGIDATVSSTTLIMQQIEQNLPAQALIHLRVLREAELELVEATVGPRSPVVGKLVRELQLPAETLILVVIHDGRTSVATPESQLQSGDQIIALTPVDNEGTLRQLIVA